MNTPGRFKPVCLFSGCLNNIFRPHMYLQHLVRHNYISKVNIHVLKGCGAYRHLIRLSIYAAYITLPMQFISLNQNVVSWFLL